MAARGRPTKITPEVAEDLRRALRAGVPVQVAARACGISRRTLSRHRARLEELGDEEEAEAQAEQRLILLLSRAGSG